MTISFLRNEACEKLNREDCMGKLRELSESCKCLFIHLPAKAI